MATEAQFNANRENAKASTGPKTEDGKAKAARNNTKFGLFATNNCVQPHEKEDYDNFCDVLWSELAPLGGIEEVTAAEYVRNAWRLRRCAMAEETVGMWASRIQTNRNETRGFARPTADPVIYEECQPTQTAIDRARTQAQNGMRRAKADLDKIQATRKSQPKPETAGPTPSVQHPIQAAEPMATQVEPKSDAPRVGGEANPTLSDRNPERAVKLMVEMPEQFEANFEPQTESAARHQVNCTAIPLVKKAA